MSFPKDNDYIKVRKDLFPCIAESFVFLLKMREKYGKNVACKAFTFSQNVMHELPVFDVLEEDKTKSR